MNANALSFISSEAIMLIGNQILLRSPTFLNGVLSLQISNLSFLPWLLDPVPLCICNPTLHLCPSPLPSPCPQQELAPLLLNSCPFSGSRTLLAGVFFPSFLLLFFPCITYQVLIPTIKLLVLRLLISSMLLSPVLVLHYHIYNLLAIVHTVGMPSPVKLSFLGCQDTLFSLFQSPLPILHLPSIIYYYVFWDKISGSSG